MLHPVKLEGINRSQLCQRDCLLLKTTQTESSITIQTQGKTGTVIRSAQYYQS